ncbi:MAG TPA: hypothetical protein VNW97_13400 [Candidatus Saccharimonadales bacterium]|jgi:hypothetical protein|nr:hypothetical protein [Candidatus Saccharimonadales bacterium]
MPEDFQPRRSSPVLYRVAAVLFFLIAAALFWAYFAQHERIYLVFGGITLLNALMATLKSLVVRGIATNQHE